MEGLSHAACDRETLAGQDGTAEEGACGTYYQRRDGGSGLRRRGGFGRVGGDQFPRLGGEGLQAGHREQAGAALQEAWLWPVGITVMFSSKEIQSTRRVFFSSKRRHTRFDCDWSSTCALPI